MAKTLYTFQADLKQLENLQRLLKNANKELNNMQKGATNSKKGIDKQTQSTKQLNTQLDATKRKAAQVATATKQVTGAGRNMVNVFQSAAVAIAAAFTVRAIAGGVRGMINVFREFESRMAAVKAISGATNEEFIELESTALELGRTTVYSAAQIAKLQEEYARLGFTTEEILKAQKATVALAAATGEDLGNAAATAGSVLRAFGYDAEQTARVVDVMAHSFTNSALNLERFTESMKFVAPIARTVGFTLEETTAMLMKLADAGLHGSIAGNALKNIFLKLGDANSDLTRHLGGPVRGMNELVDRLLELKESGFGATQAAELLEKRATPAFITLIESAEDLRDVGDALQFVDGAAQQMAAIRLDTLEGDLVLMKSAMEGLGIALADEFDVTMRQVVDSFTKLLQAFANSETALKVFRTTVVFLTGAIAGLLLKMALWRAGALLATAGTWAWNTAKAALRITTALFHGGLTGATVAIGRMTIATKGATIAQRAFNTVLAATPWGLIAMAVGGLITAFSSLGDETDDVTFKTERMYSALEQAFNNLDGLQDGEKKLVEARQQLKDQFPEILKGIDIEIASMKDLERIKNIILTQNRASFEADTDLLTQAKDKKKMFDQNRELMLAELVLNFEQIKSLTRLNSLAEEMGIIDWSVLMPDGENMTTDLDVLTGEMTKFIEGASNLWQVVDPSSAEWEEGVTGFWVSDLAQMFHREFIDAKQKYEIDLMNYVEFMDELDLDVGDQIFGPNRKILNSDDWTWSEELSFSFKNMEGEYVRTSGGMFDEIIKNNTQNQDKVIEGLEDNIRNSIVKLADVGHLVVGEMGVLQNVLRNEYLEALEVFKDEDTDRKTQDELMAEVQSEVDVLIHIQEMYNQMATAVTEKGREEIREQYLKGVSEETRILIEGYATRIGITEDSLKLEYGVRLSELQRHLSNMKINLKKSTTDLNKIRTKSNKFRLEKTKDVYKKLLQAQADFHSDELRSEREQAKAKMLVNQDEMKDEVKLNYANIAEIERIRERLKSGKEAGEFINTKNIIKNYDVLKQFSKATMKEFQEVYKTAGDGTQGMTEVITAEIITIGENGEQIITEQSFTLTEVLNAMIAEEQQKMANNIQYLLQQTASFERQMENIALEGKHKAIDEHASYLEAIIAQEKMIGGRSDTPIGEDDAGNKEKLLGKNRFARAREVATMIFNMEKQKIEDLRLLKIKQSEEDEKRVIDEMKENGATHEEIIAMEQQFANEQTRINNDAKAQQMQNEVEYAEDMEDLFAQQIQHYADIYNQIFDMFSQLQNNKLDLQMKRDEQYHENKTKQFAAELERELELLDGNQEAQENMRKVYAMRQETLDEQLEKKQQDIARKRFKTEKANNIVQAIINGALAMTKVSAQTGVATFVFSPLIAALTAAQVATIASQQFVGEKGGLIPQFGGGGMVYGPSHAQGGVKFNAGGRVVELEGGEAVINKRSTDMFRPQLSAMNAAGGGVRFADGGIAPGTSNMLNKVGGGMSNEIMAQQIITGINSKRVIVTESDISSTQTSVAVNESNSSLF